MRNLKKLRTTFGNAYLKNKYSLLLPAHFNREREAKPTNICEIKALIGILYLAGVSKANHMNYEMLAIR